MPATKDSVLSAIEQGQIRFVDLWFTDIMGLVKSVSIPVREIEQVIENGSHFDGSAIDGFARVAESDMVLMPDLDTFTLLPTEDGAERTARMICSIQTPQGDPFIGDPRNALLRVLKQAREMGFAYKTGMEMEFFLFKLDSQGKPMTKLPNDEGGYFDMSNAPARTLRREMMAILEAMGIAVDSAHSEIGMGQHEIDFAYAPALATADQIVTARVVLKTIAGQHGLHCTFMPRPCAEMPGSGMHTHQSLHSVQDDHNVFVDANHEYGLSDTARHFLAGQLCHARAMCAVLAPLVNSYKRLGTSFEAPVHVTWAHINRAALIRVPSVTAGQESHTRLELRCPDPSANPYLATAVMLAAGLDGIRQQMSLPEPLEETLLMQNRGRLRSVEMLPTSLGEALDALEQSDGILAALGPYISDRYLEAKKAEFADYNQQVTAWEVGRYMGRY